MRVQRACRDLHLENAVQTRDFYIHCFHILGASIHLVTSSEHCQQTVTDDDQMPFLQESPLETVILQTDSNMSANCSLAVMFYKQETVLSGDGK